MRMPQRIMKRLCVRRRLLCEKVDILDQRFVWSVIRYMGGAVVGQRCLMELQRITMSNLLNRLFCHCKLVQSFGI
jgi:hypothetical protein